MWQLQNSSESWTFELPVGFGTHCDDEHHDPFGMPFRLRLDPGAPPIMNVNFGNGIKASVADAQISRSPSDTTIAL